MYEILAFSLSYYYSITNTTFRDLEKRNVSMSNNLPSIREMCVRDTGDYNLAEYKCPKYDHIVHDLLVPQRKSEMNRSKKISYIDIAMK